MNSSKIREARKLANFTQGQLADALGINRATLSKYENGIIEPSISQLVRIAQELEISPTQLLPDSLTESWQTGRDFGSEIAIQQILEYGYRLYDEERELINLYWALNVEGRQKATERVEELTEIPRYQAGSPAQAAGDTPPPSPEGKDPTPPPPPPESP